MKASLNFLSIITLAAILCLAFGCQANEELEKFRLAESLKASNIGLSKQFYKYLDAVNTDSLNVMAVDPNSKFIYYESGDPISFIDIEPLIKMFYTSFPDYKHNIEEIYAVDDKVVARITYTGTFKKDFMDIKPNGAQFKYKGIQIFQFADGKIKNFWAVEDELGMMTQLGMELKPVKEKK
jgi:predicted ester cyclase